MTDLCKHDWVGDDECVYCENEELKGDVAILESALKAMLHKAYKQNWNDNYPDEVAQAEAAIDKAEAIRNEIDIESILRMIEIDPGPEKSG